MKSLSVKDLPIQERRKAYNAMNRRMNNPIGLKAGVVEKYLACKGQDAKRFQLLKEFICDPDLNLICILGMSWVKGYVLYIVTAVFNQVD